MPATAPTERPVDEFIDEIGNDRRRDDTRAAVDLISAVTGAQPCMWGASIIGFGDRPYTTADGKSHDWFVLGVSPRAKALTFYGLTFYGSNGDLLARLGRHTTGKGCVYVPRFDDVDVDVLTELIRRSWAG